MYFVASDQKRRNVTWRGYPREHPNLTFTYRKRLGHCASNKVFKTRPIRVADLQDTRPDQIPTAIFQILIPDRHDRHFHWSTRQLELHIQLPISPRQVMLTNPNCRNNQRHARAAYVHRVPIERRQTPRTIRARARIRQTQREIQTRPHTPRMTPVANKTAYLRHDSAGQFRHP